MLSLCKTIIKGAPLRRMGAVSVTTGTVRIKGQALFSMQQRDPFKNRPSFSFPWVQQGQCWLSAGSPRAQSQNSTLLHSSSRADHFSTPLNILNNNYFKKTYFSHSSAQKCKIEHHYMMTFLWFLILLCNTRAVRNKIWNNALTVSHILDQKLSQDQLYKPLSYA